MELSGVFRTTAATASPRIVLERQVLGHRPDLLSQIFYEWGPFICVLTSLARTLLPIKGTALGALKKSDAHSSVQGV